MEKLGIFVFIGMCLSLVALMPYSGVSRFGFELTAEDNSGNKKGMFTITDASETKLANNNKSVTHTSSGLRKHKLWNRLSGTSESGF